MEPSDPWVERLARLFREHPAWQQAARLIDSRATSSVFFRHRPGEPWHLERRGDETLLLPGPAADPDFAFRFPPAAIARLEAVRGGAGDFAAELFTLALSDDPGVRVDLRIAAGFARLLRRGYVRLVVAAGSPVRALGAAHGVLGVRGMQRLVATLRKSEREVWETELPPSPKPRAALRRGSSTSRARSGFRAGDARGGKR
jgi:hypothetical protein